MEGHRRRREHTQPKRSRRSLPRGLAVAMMRASAEGEGPRRARPLQRNRDHAESQHAPGHQLAKCISHGSKVERRGTKYLGELPLGLRLLSAIVPSVLRYLGHRPGNFGQATSARELGPGSLGQATSARELRLGNSGRRVGLAPTSHLHARRPSGLSCSRRWSPAKLAPACRARGQISEL